MHILTKLRKLSAKTSYIKLRAGQEATNPGKKTRLLPRTDFWNRANIFVIEGYELGK
jgi:hypothetical protein